MIAPVWVGEAVSASSALNESHLDRSTNVGSISMSQLRFRHWSNQTLQNAHELASQRRMRAAPAISGIKSGRRKKETNDGSHASQLYK
jgi:hypothetical protein